MFDLKLQSNKLINWHLLISFVLALASVLYNKNFALAFMAGSIVFNVYLRLLQNAFWISLAAKLKLEIENKTLLIIFSAFRAFFVASSFVFFILKLNFSLTALALSFICYNIILVASPFIIKQ
jgi:hypothetical protein